jgi:hypothetical protein
MPPETQTYETHRLNPRLTGIGFTFLLLAGILLALRWFRIGGRATFAAGLAAMMASVLVLLVISRVYTTRLQDRIIKLEMKLRLASFGSATLLATAARLSKAQVIALRFASDEELPALIDRADRERLTPDQIKRAVKNWQPDFDRT